MARARISDIAVLASRLSGVPLKELKGPGRYRRLVFVRTGIIVVAREHGHSFPEIGRVMNRDHSTIVHCFHNAPAYARIYPELNAFIQSLSEEAETTTPFLDGMRFDFTIPPRPPKPIKRKIRPRNDFSAGKHDPDDSHAFHDGIKTGSASLLAAIEQARAA